MGTTCFMARRPWNFLSLIGRASWNTLIHAFHGTCTVPPVAVHSTQEFSEKDCFSWTLPSWLNLKSRESHVQLGLLLFCLVWYLRSKIHWASWFHHVWPRYFDVVRTPCFLESSEYAFAVYIPLLVTANVAPYHCLLDFWIFFDHSLKMAVLKVCERHSPLTHPRCSSTFPLYANWRG